MKKGRYIVIEGADGTGKGKQAKMLLERLRGIGVQAVSVFEPGWGSAMSQRIRMLLKDKSMLRDPMTNVLLFNASRVETLTALGRNLNEGIWVVSDRNRISTAVYQGHAEGINLDLIYSLELSLSEITGVEPDVELVLSATKAVTDDRLVHRLSGDDYFESLPSFERVPIGYLYEAKRRGLEVIDAAGTPEDVHDQIWDHIQPLLAEGE